MPIKFYPDVTKPVTLPMACDPSVQASNDSEVITDYLRTSNPDKLVVPDDSTRVVLKPLTHAEMGEVRRVAGMAPMFGIKVQEKLESAADRDAAEMALSDIERAAHAEYEAWLYKFRTAMVLKSLQSVVGWEKPESGWEEALDSIRPISVRTAFLVEAALHAQNLSNLNPEGKA